MTMKYTEHTKWNIQNKTHINNNKKTYNYKQSINGTNYYSSSVVQVPRWLGGLLVERRTSVSQIRGSIPGQALPCKNLGQVSHT